MGMLLALGWRSTGELDLPRSTDGLRCQICRSYHHTISPSGPGPVTHWPQSRTWAGHRHSHYALPTLFPTQISTCPVLVGVTLWTPSPPPLPCLGLPWLPVALQVSPEPGPGARHPPPCTRSSQEASPPRSPGEELQVLQAWTSCPDSGPVPEPPCMGWVRAQGWGFKALCSTPVWQIK